MTETLTYRKILVFWLPLAGTWLMVAAEGPFLAALIARLPDPAANLAAFGVTFAFAIIIESPVLMLMSASTALAEDGPSYFALRRFSVGLAALLAIAQLIVLVPAVFHPIAALLHLPPEVTRLTHTGLAFMLPWPAAIAYRRLRQGLLIRQDLTRRVAYGAVVRFMAMSATALVALATTGWPGTQIAALALSSGAVTEAIASHVMTRTVVSDVVQRPRAPERMASLRLAALARFYLPLALTSFIALSSQPIVTAFMGQARFALESLAVLPVIHGLTFIFRVIGLSYFEVAIALFGDGREHLDRLRTFAAGLALVATVGLSTVAFTPLSRVWFETVSGLPPSLATFALGPIRIMAVLPALSVGLHFLRAVLVHTRQTRPITGATVAELVGVIAVLIIAIHGFNAVGAVAAALALVIGRVIGVATLVPAVVHALGRRGPPFEART